jgi:hypothetical protein
MESKRLLLTALTTLALVHWAPAGRAQGQLATAQSVRCTFARQSVGTWEKDGSPEATLRPAMLVLRFEAIDADGGTAQIRNGTIVSDVTVRAASGYLNFMQAFRTGPLYTTTVFEAGASGGRFKAVHSRHEYFTVAVSGATSSPEQYYGECEVVS